MAEEWLTYLEEGSLSVTDMPLIASIEAEIFRRVLIPLPPIQDRYRRAAYKGTSSV